MHGVIRQRVARSPQALLAAYIREAEALQRRLGRGAAREGKPSHLPPAAKQAARQARLDQLTRLIPALERQLGGTP